MLTFTEELQQHMPPQVLQRTKHLIINMIDGI